jgi:hypothetical protein
MNVRVEIKDQLNAESEFPLHTSCIWFCVVFCVGRTFSRVAEDSGEWVEREGEMKEELKWNFPFSLWKKSLFRCIS